MSDFATYSLGVVLRETGINPDTLRAWERRYDLPQPSRSEGGQRLYTERDIALIKWLLERTNEGMRIGCAVKLWKSKIAAGEDPLLQHSAAPTEIDEGSPFVDFQKKWIAACIDFDEATAEAVTDEAFARFTPETAFTEIFIPAIREVGELWYRGEASVQQEHFASNLVTRRLGAIISSIPRPTRPEKVIIGCPPNEEHTIALQLTSLYLRRRGFNVIDLGANVPLAQFVETAEKIKPTLVILAAQQLISAATLAETIQTLDEQNITTAYAGRIFSTTPALRERVYGHFLGETLNEGIQNAEFVLNKKIVPIIIKQTRNPLENMLKSFDF
jgi:methanogenic corrinoid protein MtbC1